MGTGTRTRSGGMRATAWTAALRRLGERQSLIVCHHGVGRSRRATDPSLLQVPPERFRQQLEILGGAGFEFRTMAQLLAEANGGPLPPGRAVITFDDGMEDNYSAALPILRSLGVPATVYVATGYIGAPNPWMSEESGQRMMRPDELREMVAAGIELGAHTVTHPDLSTLDYASCVEEMARGRAELEEAAGVRATTFAYPFGRFGEAAHRAARDVGFDAAVAANGFGDVADRFAIPRALLWGTDRNAIMYVKAAGMWEPAFHHPSVRFAREHTRTLRHRVRAVRDGRA